MTDPTPNIHELLNEQLHEISNLADGIRMESEGKFHLTPEQLAELRTNALEIVAAIDEYGRLLTAQVPA